MVGVDLTDFSRLNNERFTSFVCDQSKRDDLRAVAAKLEPGSFDVIIDDGSHASVDEQLTLRRILSAAGRRRLVFIEDLDWQPPGEDRAKIALTKTLLREIQEHGAARSIDPLGVSALAGQFAEILFFDSHYELNRAKLMGGLVAIRKRGGAGLVDRQRRRPFTTRSVVAGEPPFENRSLHHRLERSGACRALGQFGGRCRLSHRRRYRQHRRYGRAPDARRA